MIKSSYKPNMNDQIEQNEQYVLKSYIMGQCAAFWHNWSVLRLY